MSWDCCGWSPRRAFALYERPRPIEALYGAVAAGEVDRVRLVGGLSPGDTGYASVTARWDQGWFSYTAEVRETSGARGIPVRATLAGIDDGLVVIEEDFPRGLIVGDRRVPSWLGWSMLAVWLGLVFLLVNGPVPWRATRWAWFWLVLSPLGH